MSILCFTKEMQSFLGKRLANTSTVVPEKPPQTLLFCWGVYSQTTNFSLRMRRQNDLNVIPTVLYITTSHKSKLLRRGWVYLFILSIIFCESMRKKIFKYWQSTLYYTVFLGALSMIPCECKGVQILRDKNIVCASSVCFKCLCKQNLCFAT